MSHLNLSVHKISKIKIATRLLAKERPDDAVDDFTVVDIHLIDGENKEVFLLNVFGRGYGDKHQQVKIEVIDVDNASLVLPNDLVKALIKGKEFYKKEVE